MNNSTRMKGFTLIELLVALVISMILLGGIMKLMSSTKRTYDYQSDNARVQENGRFALDFMSRSTRMAGYFGCTNENPGGFLGITGVDGGGFNDSDTLMVSYLDTTRSAFRIVHCPRSQDDGIRYKMDGSTCTGSILSNPSPLLKGKGSSESGGDPLVMNNSEAAFRGPLQAGDMVVAADCLKNDLYTVNKVSDTALYLNTRVTGKPGLTESYRNGNRSYGAELRQLLVYRFFVADPDGDGIASLYRDTPVYCDGAGNYDTAAGADINMPANFDSAAACNPARPGPAEELVEGVEALQIRYGEDFATDDDLSPNTYRTAGGVGSWANVVAVRLNVLVRTPDTRKDRDAVTQDYTTEMDPDLAAGTLTFDAAPENLARRKIFSTTVELRNNTLL